MQEYSDREFIKICVTYFKVLFSIDLSALVAQLLPEKGEKHIRKVLNIAKLIRPMDDEKKIKKVIDT